MKSKLKYLIEDSLNKKIKTKWFKVINIILAILVIGICNIDRIINIFGGDFSKPKEVLVVSSNNNYELFKNNFEQITLALNDISKYEIKLSTLSINTLTKDMDKKKIVINLQEDSEEYLKAEIYSFDPLTTIDRELFQNALSGLKTSIVIQNSSLTEKEIAGLSSPISIDLKIMNPDADSEAKDLVSTGIITIFIVPIFLLIVLLVQMLGNEINEEKTTRGMEIIISSVPAKDHFISKIYASLKYVLIQGGLVLLYGGAGLLIRLFLNKISGKAVLATGLNETFGEVKDLLTNSGVLESLLIALPIILLLMIISFLIYSIIAAVLASMTTSADDYQQLQTPLVLIMVVGYYIALMAALFDGSVFIKITSFIPMISFLVAPSIYLLGQIGIIELIISTLLSFGFLVIIYHYGIKIYKEGILNYSSTDLWKKIFKSMKKS